MLTSNVFCGNLKMSTSSPRGKWANSPAPGDIIIIWHHGRVPLQRNSMQNVELLSITDQRTFNNSPPVINTLRPRQNGRHFPEDIFKWIFFNKNVWISINISLTFVPRGSIKNIPTLVQVAWRRPGDKPLSEPMMVKLPTHICVTQPEWVNSCFIW